tara:strand:- start:261 stop:491 length:231 start_codon:yes stop_codon:yes gene_type:complete
MLFEDETPRALPGLTHIHTQRVFYRDAKTGKITSFCVFRYRHDATGGLVIGMHERYRLMYQKMRMPVPGPDTELAR